MAKSLSSEYVTVLLYIDGQVLEGENGVHYSRSPAKAIRVCRKTTFSHLRQKICQSLNINEDVTKVRMTCRYPVFTSNARVNFAALPLLDDEDVSIALDSQTTCQSIHAIELYLAPEPTCANASGLDIGSGKFFSEHCHKSVGKPGDTSNAVLNCGDEMQQHNISPSNAGDVVQIIAAGRHESPVCISQSPPSKQSDEELTVPDLHVVTSIASEEMADELGATNSRGDQDARPDNDDPDKSNDGLARCREWNLSTELCRGMTFNSKEELKNAVKIYNVRRNHNYHVVESTRTIWVAKCIMDSKCGWKLRACKRKNRHHFEITKYWGPHICVKASSLQGHSHLDSTLIANEIVDIIKRDPSTPVPTLQEFLKTRFSYALSYRKVWMGKQKAVAGLFGNSETNSS